MAESVRYRLFVDEWGSAYGADRENPHKRYFALVGAIVRDEHRAPLDAEFAAIKQRYFRFKRPQNVAFHRADIVGGKRDFGAARDPAVLAAITADLVALIARTDFVALAVVIDKAVRREPFDRLMASHYHYAMKLMLERYAQFLDGRAARGDVVAEMRNKTDDDLFRVAFAATAEIGTEWVTRVTMHKRIVPRSVTLYPKTPARGGLELADLIAQPLARGVLVAKQRAAHSQALDVAIANAAAPKFRRSPFGKAEGWGWTLL